MINNTLTGNTPKPTMRISVIIGLDMVETSLGTPSVLLLEKPMQPVGDEGQLGGRVFAGEGDRQDGAAEGLEVEWPKAGTMELGVDSEAVQDTVRTDEGRREARRGAGVIRTVTALAALAVVAAAAMNHGGKRYDAIQKAAVDAKAELEKAERQKASPKVIRELRAKADKAADIARVNEIRKGEQLRRAFLESEAARDHRTRQDGRYPGNHLREDAGY